MTYIFQERRKWSTDATAGSCSVARRCCRGTRRWRTLRRGYVAGGRRRPRSNLPLNRRPASQASPTSLSKLRLLENRAHGAIVAPLLMQNWTNRKQNLQENRLTKTQKLRQRRGNQNLKSLKRSPAWSRGGRARTGACPCRRRWGNLCRRIISRYCNK